MAHDVTRHVTTEEFEVCVVGGGLAGVCAALAAARLGARTALVNDRPMLGGNSSSELRVPPSGAGHFNPWGRETGIIHELITEDRARNHDPVAYGRANAIWDLVLYDACRREEALTLFLNTHVACSCAARLPFTSPHGSSLTPPVTAAWAWGPACRIALGRRRAASTMSRSRRRSPTTS